MKKYVIDTILVIVGIICLAVGADPKYEFVQGLGVGVIALAIVLFFMHYKEKKATSQYPHSGSLTSEYPSASSQPSEYSTSSQPQSVRRDYSEDDKQTVGPSKVGSVGQVVRTDPKIRLDRLVGELKSSIKEQIFGLVDISYRSSSMLDDNELSYIAKQLTITPFSISAWDLNEKITNTTLTDAEILKIFDLGSERIINTLTSSYADNSSWIMPNALLEKFIAKNPLLLFSFQNYRKETLSMIIDKLSAYELLGYRIKARTPEEETDCSITDLQKSTEDNEVEIEFYEDLETDMVYYLEQNYPEEADLRKKAFEKILAGSANVIGMIERLDDVTESEAQAIFARNYEAELEALFDRGDSDSLVACIPLMYAVKAVLQLIPCEFKETISDNYDFQSASKDEYLEIIKQLTPDELLSFDEDGGCDYDFISLLEDNSVEGDDLRKEAFDKMIKSEHCDEAISRWSSITEYEISQIIASENGSLVEALFDRDDTDSVVENLPDAFIIKARLGLIDVGDSDQLNDEYDSRMENNEKFSAKIKKFALLVV